MEKLQHRTKHKARESTIKEGDFVVIYNAVKGKGPTVGKERFLVIEESEGNLILENNKGEKLSRNVAFVQKCVEESRLGLGVEDATVNDEIDNEAQPLAAPRANTIKVDQPIRRSERIAKYGFSKRGVNLIECLYNVESESPEVDEDKLAQDDLM